jgi:quinoprotein glucose dehydrogenase
MRLAVILFTVSIVLGACRQPSADAEGAELYAQLCANCHGSDLEGSAVGPPLDAGSSAAEKPDDYYVVTITRGKGRMPSFPRLTEEQLDRLIGYIRERQEQG